MSMPIDDDDVTPPDSTLQVDGDERDAAPIETDAPEVREDGEYLIAIMFDRPGRAAEVLVNVGNLAKEGVVGVTDAVIITKDDSGRAKVQQTLEITPGRGALLGGWMGLIVGLFTGPAAPLVWAGGAAAGAIYGKFTDRGLDDGWIKDMADWLQPNSSALLLLGSIHDKATALREIGRYEGRVVSTDLPDRARAELAEALGDDAAPPRGL
ncbi:MAG: DUF1269 domain-containing protein [Acidimicrobiia bacterium]|nr:DUF1269 domain-containing protein [Acidimicrobiia bacterium]